MLEMRLNVTRYDFENTDTIDKIIEGTEEKTNYKLSSRSGFYPNRGNPDEGRVYLKFIKEVER